METALKRSPGMQAFSVVWLGQLVSMLGTRMTSFALYDSALALSTSQPA